MGANIVSLVLKDVNLPCNVMVLASYNMVWEFTTWNTVLRNNLGPGLASRSIFGAHSLGAWNIQATAVFGPGQGLTQSHYVSSG